MDLNRITEEVTRELLAELQVDQALNSPLLPRKNILFVFQRAEIPLDKLLDELARWKSRAGIRALVPKWAHSLWGLARFESKGLPIQCVSYTDRKVCPKELMANTDRLVILGATASSLAQIAKMKRESLPASLVVQALSHNKPVTLLDDEMMDNTQSVIKKVAAMGIRLLPYSELAKVFPLPPVPLVTPVATQRRQPSGVAAGTPIYGNSTPSRDPQTESPHPPARPMPVDCHGCTQAGQCATLCTDRILQMVASGAERIASNLGIHSVPVDFARLIDHTLLKPEATEAQIRQLCVEASQHKFASVCVNPSYVKLCRELLQGSGVMVCTVIGFPLGATDTQTKADETRTAVANGADEIDMVLPIGALKSKNYKLVEADIRAVVQAAQGHTVKVILETALLNDEEKITSCELSKKAGAHFVKTSTGFGPGGATEHDIALMRQTVGPQMGVKASGGVRDREFAEKMVRAGATRIGASSSVSIVTGQLDRGSDKSLY